MMPDGTPFDRRDIRPQLAGDSLCIVRRNGDVLGFDANDGRQPLWVRPGMLEQVHVIDMNESALVLAGRRNRLNEDDPIAHEVIVLDPKSGRTIHRLTPIDGHGVRWLRIGHMGELVFATESGLEFFNALSGVRLWANRAYETRGFQRRLDHRRPCGHC